MGRDKLAPINPEALRRIIEKRDLKKYWVAMQLGIQKSTLRRWLNGHTAKMRKVNMHSLQTLLEFDEWEWKH